MGNARSFWWEAEEEGTASLCRVARARDAGLTLLSLAYLACGALHGARGLPAPPGPLLVMAALPVLAVATARIHAARRDRGAAWLRAIWPVVVAPQVYLSEVRLVELQRGRYHDDLLASVDGLLGLARDGRPVVPLGGALEEAANLLYASYWLVPALVGVVGLRAGPAGAARATAALSFTSVACGLMWLAVPSGGYHPTGSPGGEPYGPFTAFVHEVYARQPHHAAAFPSEHVGHAAAIAWVLRSAGVGPWIWLWVVGVAASTVLGQYHFAADAAVGFLFGLAGAVAAAAAGRSGPDHSRGEVNDPGRAQPASATASSGSCPGSPPPDRGAPWRP